MIEYHFHDFSGKYKMEEEKSGPAFYNKLMKLQIYNITHEDLGTYKCLAKNSQGETSGEIELYGEFGFVTWKSQSKDLEAIWDN